MSENTLKKKKRDTEQLADNLLPWGCAMRVDLQGVYGEGRKTYQHGDDDFYLCIFKKPHRPYVDAPDPDALTEVTGAAQPAPSSHPGGLCLL